MKSEFLKEKLEKYVKDFKEKNISHIKIIAKSNLEGITSASIIARAFIRLKINFSISFYKLIDKGLVKEIQRDSAKFIFILGQSMDIKEKEVFLITKENLEKALSPSFLNISQEEINLPGLAYLFARELNKKNYDKAHLTLIDIYKKQVEELTAFQREFLHDAIESGKIESRPGILLFPYNSKPLARILSELVDPFIPEFNGSEEKTFLFLKELGIENKDIVIRELNEEQLKKLFAAIVIKKVGYEKEEENIIGNIYLLKNEEILDLRELFYAVKSSIRFNKTALAVSACLGNKESQIEIFNLLNEFNHNLSEALMWIYNNRKSNNVIIKENFVLINLDASLDKSILNEFNFLIKKFNIYDVPIIISKIQTSFGLTYFSITNTRESLEKIPLIEKALFHEDSNTIEVVTATEKEELFLDELLKSLETLEIEKLIKST